MRSKAPLALMEQMVMLLVFAMAAALCLQAFVTSDRLSRRDEARDRAVVLCQSAAEVIRHTGGDFSRAAELLGAQVCWEDSLVMFCDEDWQPTEPTSPGVYPAGYSLGIGLVESGVPGLGMANVWVRDDNDDGEEPLFLLPVTWQTPLDAAIPQADKDRAREEALTLAAEIRRCREAGLDLPGNLAGESDGLGGWHQYFDSAWAPQSSYANAVYELWYSQGKVEAVWNQTGADGVITGTRVILCTVGLEEVSGLG